ncbi:MAG: CDP-alcohol phosphatidyltransferase family protein [Candidatus Methylacidiphilales bacterium]|nr:CDP-alcohol phosphatidyltransferase family protein [Candidatus Methylacidiphilales bacterium]
MTLANKITIGRLLLIPVFIAAMLYYEDSRRAGAPEENWRYLAFAIFTIAAISDAVDGYLARHCGQATRLGAILDPLADKLLLFAALMVLAISKIGSDYPFPLWFPIILLTRDALLILGFSIFHFMHITVEVKPHWTGKLSTVFTFASVCSGLLKLPTTYTLCAAGAVLAIAATYVYIHTAISVLGETDALHPQPRPQAKK